jgi:hypothetical protein
MKLVPEVWKYLLETTTDPKIRKWLEMQRDIETLAKCRLTIVVPDAS